MPGASSFRVACFMALAGSRCLSFGSSPRYRPFLAPEAASFCIGRVSAFVTIVLGFSRFSMFGSVCQIDIWGSVFMACLHEHVGEPDLAENDSHHIAPSIAQGMLHLGSLVSVGTTGIRALTRQQP